MQAIAGLRKKINELKIGEETKEQLRLALLNQSDEEAGDSEEEEDDWPLNAILFGEEDDCNCNHYEAILNRNGLNLNVLTTEEDMILKFIDKIEDSQEKQKVVESYIALTQEANQARMKKKTQDKAQHYSLKEILKRIEK